MEPVFSDWLTGTLSDEGWGPRDDKIVQFASHYFLYFPIFHLKYSYIFPIFCPSEFLYSYFFVKQVTGRPAVSLISLTLSRALCGLRGCKNRAAPFPGRMSYNATKPGLVSVLCLSMCYTVLFGPFYILLVFVAMCSLFWLFWLSCHYLPSDWLERLLWGSLYVGRGIIHAKPRPNSAYDFFDLVYFFIVSLCVCLVP